MHKITSQDLVEKTITSIDTTCCNVLHLSFSDGTKLSIWAESGGSYGIPFLLTDGEEIKEEDEEIDYNDHKWSDFENMDESP